MLSTYRGLMNTTSFPISTITMRISLFLPFLRLGADYLRDDADEDAADQDGGDQRKRNKHICFDIKCSNQPDDCFHDNRNRVFADIQTPEDAAKMSGKEVAALNNRIAKLRADITLWENNMGFISSAKSSNVLRREFERKIQAAKQDLALLEAKLKMVKDAPKEA